MLKAQTKKIKNRKVSKILAGSLSLLMFATSNGSFLVWGLSEGQLNFLGEPAVAQAKVIETADAITVDEIVQKNQPKRHWWANLGDVFNKWLRTSILAGVEVENNRRAQNVNKQLQQNMFGPSVQNQASIGYNKYGVALSSGDTATKEWVRRQVAERIANGDENFSPSELVIHDKDDIKSEINSLPKIAKVNGEYPGVQPLGELEQLYLNAFKEDLTFYPSYVVTDDPVENRKRKLVDEKVKEVLKLRKKYNEQQAKKTAKAVRDDQIDRFKKAIEEKKKTGVDVDIAEKLYKKVSKDNNLGIDASRLKIRTTNLDVLNNKSNSAQQSSKLRSIEQVNGWLSSGWGKFKGWFGGNKNRTEITDRDIASFDSGVGDTIAGIGENDKNNSSYDDLVAKYGKDDMRDGYGDEIVGVKEQMDKNNSFVTNADGNVLLGVANNDSGFWDSLIKDVNTFYKKTTESPIGKIVVNHVPSIRDAKRITDGVSAISTVYSQYTVKTKPKSKPTIIIKAKSATEAMKKAFPVDSKITQQGSDTSIVRDSKGNPIGSIRKDVNGYRVVKFGDKNYSSGSVNQGGGERKILSTEFKTIEDARIALEKQHPALKNSVKHINPDGTTVYYDKNNRAILSIKKDISGNVIIKKFNQDDKNKKGSTNNQNNLLDILGELPVVGKPLKNVSDLFKIAQKAPGTIDRIQKGEFTSDDLTLGVGILGLLGVSVSTPVLLGGALTKEGYDEWNSKSDAEKEKIARQLKSSVDDIEKLFKESTDQVSDFISEAGQVIKGVGDNVVVMMPSGEAGKFTYLGDGKYFYSTDSKDTTIYKKTEKGQFIPVLLPDNQKKKLISNAEIIETAKKDAWSGSGFSEYFLNSENKDLYTNVYNRELQKVQSVNNALNEVMTEDNLFGFSSDNEEGNQKATDKQKREGVPELKDSKKTRLLPVDWENNPDKLVDANGKLTEEVKKAGYILKNGQVINKEDIQELEKGEIYSLNEKTGKYEKCGITGRIFGRLAGCYDAEKLAQRDSNVVALPVVRPTFKKITIEKDKYYEFDDEGRVRECFFNTTLFGCTKGSEFGKISNENDDKVKQDDGGASKIETRTNDNIGQIDQVSPKTEATDEVVATSEVSSLVRVEPRKTKLRMEGDDFDDKDSSDSVWYRPTTWFNNWGGFFRENNRDNYVENNQTDGGLPKYLLNNGVGNDNNTVDRGSNEYNNGNNSQQVASDGGVNSDMISGLANNPSILPVGQIDSDVLKLTENAGTVNNPVNVSSAGNDFGFNQFVEKGLLPGLATGGQRGILAMASGADNDEVLGIIAQDVIGSSMNGAVDAVFGEDRNGDGIKEAGWLAHSMGNVAAGVITALTAGDKGDAIEAASNLVFEAGVNALGNSGIIKPEDVDTIKGATTSYLGQGMIDMAKDLTNGIDFDQALEHGLTTAAVGYINQVAIPENADLWGGTVTDTGLTGAGLSASVSSLGRQLLNGSVDVQELGEDIIQGMATQYAIDAIGDMATSMAIDSLAPNVGVDIVQEVGSKAASEAIGSYGWMAKAAITVGRMLIDGEIDATGVATTALSIGATVVANMAIYGTASGVATGAAAGSVVPGIGTAIGAVVGLVAGMIMGGGGPHDYEIADWKISAGEAITPSLIVKGVDPAVSQEITQVAQSGNVDKAKQMMRQALENTALGRLAMMSGLSGLLDSAVALMNNRITRIRNDFKPGELEGYNGDNIHTGDVSLDEATNRYIHLKNKLKDCYLRKDQDCVGDVSQEIRNARNGLIALATAKFNNEIAKLNKEIHDLENKLAKAKTAKERAEYEARLREARQRRDILRNARDQYNEVARSCGPGLEWHFVDHRCIPISDNKAHCEKGGGTWHGSLTTGTTGCTCDKKPGGHWMGDHCEYGFNEKQQEGLRRRDAADECSHRIGNWRWDGQNCIEISSKEAEKRRCEARGGVSNSYHWDGRQCVINSRN